MAAVLSEPSDREHELEMQGFLQSPQGRASLAAHLGEHEDDFIDPLTKPVQLTAWQMNEALDDQSTKLFTAEAIVETVMEALRTRFGIDWPIGVPDYPRSLRQAASLIRSAYENLEVATLENNSDAKAQAGSFAP